MSMIVKEATNKWCPMTRIARRESERPEGKSLSTGQVFVVGGCNTDALGGTRIPASCRCIASQCMMWRWTEGSDELGYCGLAGKP
jgi:hypothetical protein